MLTFLRFSRLSLPGTGSEGNVGGRAPSSSRLRREIRNILPPDSFARHSVPNRDPATRQRRRPGTLEKRVRQRWQIPISRQMAVPVWRMTLLGMPDRK